MRYFFGFMCVLALGFMGCSETSGTGGSAGDGGNGGAAGVGGGGVGGDGGNGGSVTDCTGDEELTPCKFEGADGLCFEDRCRVLDCSDFEDGTGCAVGEPPEDLPFGFCLDRRCVIDCGDTHTGHGAGPCDADGADGVCFFELCHVPDCSEAEPGTRCATGTGEAAEWGACEAGECATRVSDCTGIGFEPAPIACTIQDDPTRPAVCIEEACAPADCEGLENGTVCYEPPGPFFTGHFVGLCFDGACAQFQ